MASAMATVQSSFPSPTAPWSRMSTLRAGNVGGRTFGSPETDRPGPKDMRAAIDWWMTARFQEQLQNRCESFVDSVQLALITGSKESPGVEPLLAEHADIETQLADPSVHSDAGRAKMLGRRYAELVRRYHPDRNGGDRSHERALTDTIAAYQLLKGSAVFA